MSTELGRPLRPSELRVALARTHLASARHRAHVAVTTLRAEVADRVDWRVWYRERPGVWLATALVVGFMFGKRR